MPPLALPVLLRLPGGDHADMVSRPFGWMARNIWMKRTLSESMPDQKTPGSSIQHSKELLRRAKEMLRPDGEKAVLKFVLFQAMLCGPSAKFAPMP